MLVFIPRMNLMIFSGQYRLMSVVVRYAIDLWPLTSYFRNHYGPSSLFKPFLMDIDPTILYRSTHQTNTLTNTLKAGGGGGIKWTNFLTSHRRWKREGALVLCKVIHNYNQTPFYFACQDF